MSFASSSSSRPINGSITSDTGSIISGFSNATITSSVRHGNAFMTMPSQNNQNKPILAADANHNPRTRGSFGVLVVGLGGSNGTTMLAGILANRLNIHWHGPKGEPMVPNYNGCITQLQGSEYFKDAVKGLADASMCAIGGWDIRPTKLGDALLQAQILDYDLVRQIQDEMNKVKVFRGLFDPRFIGSYDDATFILTEQEAKSDSEALKCLRADIRYFKWRNGVVGHTTVIWSANVEPNSSIVTQIHTADQLLQSIEMSEEERGGPLPPSLLYATAALLEGCSFVNGSSQNTIDCPGLVDMARQQLGVYCLGSDFNAGNWQLATLQHLHNIGLKPQTIMSSLHIGNNDMRNLDASQSAKQAKLNVLQQQIQQHGIDQHVNLTFAPKVHNTRHETVEYMSLGFLGQTHTMVTYTNAIDPILCAPLLIDIAVWCDFFASRSWPYDKVTPALSYAFKVIPSSSVSASTNNYTSQLNQLQTQVIAAHESKSKRRNSSTTSVISGNVTTTSINVSNTRRVRIRPEQKVTEWAIPNNGRIMCAGLACVDMQLNNASGGDGGEAIETFEGEKSIGGGSVSMACKTLARLCHGAPLDERYVEVAPPVVYTVVPLCKVGNDDAGNKLISLLENCGSACRNVETKIIKNARANDPDARTALAVLPIYTDGRRGCFFDAASNLTFTPQQLSDMIGDLMSGSSGPPLDTSRMSYDDMENYRERLEHMTPSYGAFLFGYPHLLPMMQGESLAQIMIEARNNMENGGVVALDLNGVPEEAFVTGSSSSLRRVQDLQNDPVIGAALPYVDILHMNEDELILLTGCTIERTPQSETEDQYRIGQAVDLFLACGVAVVAVTRGRKGSFVSCNDAQRFSRSPMMPSSWINCTTQIDAVTLPPSVKINTNGAGDSFTSGLLLSSMLRHTGMSLCSQGTTDIAVYKNLDDTNNNNNNSRKIQKKKEVIQKSIPKKKLTPYTLYMRENYVSLKQQCNDDKKAIFSKCHELWENETDEIKAMYEVKAQEENKEDHVDENAMSVRVINDIETLDSSPRHHQEQHPSENMTIQQSMSMTDQALNLDSAVQFATLVAAHHIDMNTRDLDHVNIDELLERAITLPTGLQEI